MLSKKIVSLEKVNFSYIKGLPILEEVDFDMYARDFVGIIGPNGGGKTTLLKIILGLLEPDSGQVSVFGELPQAGREKIGYVPQFANISLDFPINVKNVVLTGLLGRKGLFSRYSKDDLKKAEKALDDMGILDLKNKQIGQLSGGQRQRVLIARALVRDPRLIIMDEPTASVDVSSEANLFETLKKLNKHAGIIVVSHDIGAISPFIKQVGCMNRTLQYNAEGEINEELIESGYKCDMDLLIHSAPHRRIKKHKH